MFYAHNSEQGTHLPMTTAELCVQKSGPTNTTNRLRVNREILRGEIGSPFGGGHGIPFTENVRGEPCPYGLQARRCWRGAGGRTCHAIGLCDDRRMQTFPALESGTLRTQAGAFCYPLLEVLAIAGGLKLLGRVRSRAYRCASSARTTRNARYCERD